MEKHSYFIVMRSAEYLAKFADEADIQTCIDKGCCERPNQDNWSILITDEVLGQSLLVGVRETEAEAWALVRFFEVDDDDTAVAHGLPRKYQS
jgi:hypothetical protein